MKHVVPSYVDLTPQCTDTDKWVTSLIVNTWQASSPRRELSVP